MDATIQTNLKDCHNIQELFLSWMDAQSKEKGEETFPNLKCSNGKAEKFSDDFKKSFNFDGWITEKIDPSRKTMLFICREANCTDNIVNKTMEPETSEYFWMKDQYLKWQRGESIKNKAYINFINIHTDNAALNLAYVNINKRGGFGRSNISKIGKYAKQYAEFIKREIELINPDIIVCGGVFDTIKKHNLLPFKKEIRVLNCYHPLYYKKQIISQYKFNNGEFSEISN